MEENKQVHEPIQNEHLAFKFKPSKTFKVRVGCGNIYITSDFSDKGLHKVRMQRTSKLECSPSILDPLFRSATFQSRRDIKQAIKDNKGSETNCCKKYNITVKSAMKNGVLAGFSCADALSKVLEIILKENGEIHK